MDFSYKKYIQIIKSLISSSYSFQTYYDFINEPKKQVIILRHDVDKIPKNSLRFAEIQADLDIRGSYYFRAKKCSWDEKVIKKIHNLGHEIGYHYECLTTTNGNINNAIKDFEVNLKRLRNLVPVHTICMHGSPLSKYDSKDIWKKYDYKDYDIIGEPYFDINFDEVFYLTDTGRMWDGYNYSVRDKILTHQKKWNDKNLVFHSSNDILQSIHEGFFPNKVMFNMHPQRWNSNVFAWFKEFMIQNIKNTIKYAIISHKK